MRVAHVIASLDPALGGPPAVVTRLAAAQAALDHDVSITCFASPGHEGEIAKSLQPIPGIERVGIVNVPSSRFAELMVPRRSAATLTAQMARADIAHLHGFWGPLVRLAGLHAARIGQPYALAPHGMLDPWSLRQRWLKKKLAMRIGYRRVAEQAAFLHLLNDDERRLIAPLRLPAPTRVIPNGVFIEEIEPLPARGSFESSLEELRGQPYVLFLSRLHFKKGLDFLAEAFTLLAEWRRDVRLVVAGPDGGAEADFRRRMGSRLVADRVHIVGPLWGRQKFAAIMDAACFCLPSRQEGFSMAIIEALACGTPVVISEACHFPEVAQVRAGRVVALDAKHIANALIEVLANPEAARAMGTAGRELVLSRFTWPSIARRSIAAYEEALKACDRRAEPHDRLENPAL